MGVTVASFWECGVHAVHAVHFVRGVHAVHAVQGTSTLWMQW